MGGDMQRQKPDYTDAEFEVIEPAEERDTRHWWEGWTLDWRVFGIIVLTSLAGLIARLTQ